MSAYQVQRRLSDQLRRCESATEAGRPPAVVPGGYVLTDDERAPRSGDVDALYRR